MCLHGSLSVLSPSQLLPGIVGPEPQGEWGGFAGDAQGGAIHARCVEAHVCERDRHGRGSSVRPSNEERSKDLPFLPGDITHNAHGEGVQAQVSENFPSRSSSPDASVIS